MANASACLSDAWALTHNIAGLSAIKQVTAAFSSHAIPSFEPFNRVAALFAAPIGSGAAGMSVFRFGDDLYSEQLLSLGFANRFGLASLGLKLNYIQYRASGLETRTALSASFGGIAELSPQLFFGAHIVNVNQPVIDNDSGERLPTTLTAGVLFQLSEKFLFGAELEKDLRHKPMIKSGMEYRPYRKIAFRTGFNLHPNAGFFGLGFLTHKLELGYALQVSHTIGLSHQATVLYTFKKES